MTTQSRTRKPPAVMTPSPAASEAIRQINGLLSQVSQLARSVEPLDDRLQVLTYLARVLSSPTKIDAIYDEDGRLISAATPFVAQIFAERLAAFREANADGAGKSSYEDLARLTGQTKAGVQRIIMGGAFAKRQVPADTATEGQAAA